VGRAALVKSHFAKAYDQAFFLGLDVHHVLLDFRGKRFFQLRLNVFQRGRCGGWRKDALHRLNDALHVRGAFHVFDGLDVGEWNRFHVA
jgi:hypothetical protein